MPVETLSRAQILCCQCHTYTECESSIQFEIQTDFLEGIVDTVADGEKKGDLSHCLTVKSSWKKQKVFWCQGGVSGYCVTCNTGETWHGSCWKVQTEFWRNTWLPCRRRALSFRSVSTERKLNCSYNRYSILTCSLLTVSALRLCFCAFWFKFEPLHLAQWSGQGRVLASVD